MSTRRERMERRAEKRSQWAFKARAESAGRWSAATSATASIPLGQPILVDHYSARRHRAALERAQSNATKACEASARAAEHASKASNIEHALERTIFSDDDNAVEAIKAKVATLEAKRARMTLVNKLYRKGDAAALEALGLSLEALRAQVASYGMSFIKAPHEGYELSNLGGNISRLRKRIVEIERMNEKQSQCEAAGGLLIDDCGNGWCRVRFSEYPGRETVDALKAAGFMWGSGAWSGKTEAIPSCVRSATPAQEQTP